MISCALANLGIEPAQQIYMPAASACSNILKYPNTQRLCCMLCIFSELCTQRSLVPAPAGQAPRTSPAWKARRRHGKHVLAREFCAFGVMGQGARDDGFQGYGGCQGVEMVWICWMLAPPRLTLRRRGKQSRGAGQCTIAQVARFWGAGNGGE